MREVHGAFAVRLRLFLMGQRRTANAPGVHQVHDRPTKIWSRTVVHAEVFRQDHRTRHIYVLYEVIGGLSL